MMVVAACRAPPPAPVVAAPVQPAPGQGRAYAIDPGASLLTILVFRGGLLGSAGHNHVIAAHALSGDIHVTGDRPGSSFEVRFKVDQLTVDEPALREALHREDFPPEVPESARSGTRHNMLGEAVLDAAHHPEITLRSAGLTPHGGSHPDRGEVQAAVMVGVRGEEHLIHASVCYELRGEDLTVAGELPLKQTDLGLRPFSALLGALTVQDEMHVRFELRAHAQDARL